VSERIAQPDESDSKARRVRWLRVVYLIGKVVIVPLVLGGLGAYYEYRLKLAKQRDEALYAPMQEFDKRLLTLEAKMDLLVKFAVDRPAAVSPAPSPRPRVPNGYGGLGAAPTEALKNLAAMPRVEQRPLPAKLDDLVEQRAAAKK